MCISCITQKSGNHHVMNIVSGLENGCRGLAFLMLGKYVALLKNFLTKLIQDITMSLLMSSVTRIFSIGPGRVCPSVSGSQQCQLNFVRYWRVQRRNKNPIKPKHEKHIPFEPKYIPAKFRVAPPRHSQFQYKPVLNKGVEQAFWSSEDRSHPLTDDPVEGTYPQKLPDGGIRYYGFVYYPRDPDDVETLPPEEISPLFMNGDVVIVKNIPEVNEKLYLVKHLVEIKPVKLPPNLPLDADPSHCRFTEDAELIYSPDLAVTPDQLEDPEDMAAVKPHNKLIAKDCVQRWDRAWEKQFT
ncbi:hypothetical protein FHG87_011680 [Trinorchestia longiramus]|nr:hypothetical protein FHG87_011680 [Trinorchestia longiramus]